MTTLLRLLAFAALVAMIATAAGLLGGVLDPDPRGDDPEPAHAGDADVAPGHGSAGGAQPRGLAVAAGGLRLVPGDTELAAGRRERFTFRIVDEDGRTVRDFDLEHKRRIHVIVVRRDLSGYQHLHPRQAADGSWALDLRLAEAGAYRLFADFARGGVPETLGLDLTVPGRFVPRPLPHPAETADAGDGYDVHMDARGGEIAFTVRKDGRALSDIEPHLGARGHLVALRQGDLAYLHVHPDSEATAGRDIRFAVEYPSEGRYGLFLQFKHDGRVRTAVFTRDTEEVSDGHGH